MIPLIHTQRRIIRNGRYGIVSVRLETNMIRVREGDRTEIRPRLLPSDPDQQVRLIAPPKERFDPFPHKARKRYRTPFSPIRKAKDDRFRFHHRSTGSLGYRIPRRQDRRRRKADERPKNQYGRKLRERFRQQGKARLMTLRLREALVREEALIGRKRRDHQGLQFLRR